VNNTVTKNTAIGGKGGNGGGGFTAGSAGDGGYGYGAGLRINGTATLSNNLVTLNTLTGGNGGDGGSGTGGKGGTGGQIFGGGIDLEGATLNNNLVSGNTATAGNGGSGGPEGSGGDGGDGSGGGIELDDAIMFDNSITSNTLTGGNGGNGGGGGFGTLNGGKGGDVFGGGIYFDSTASVINNSVTRNLAVGGNGGNGGTVSVSLPGGNGGDGGIVYGGGLNTTSGDNFINDTVALNTGVGGNGGKGGDNNYFGSGGPGGKGGNTLGGGVEDASSSGQNSYLNDTLAFNNATGGKGGSGGLASSGPAGPAGTSGSSNGGGLYVQLSAPIFTNNLLQGNTAATSGPDYFGSVDAHATNNFVSNSSGANTFDKAKNTLNNSTNQLGSLTTASNGTSYYPLLPFTASINGGTNSVLPAIAKAEGVPLNQATDQIGNPRIVDPSDIIDIGATEFQGLTTTTLASNATTIYRTSAQNVSLTATVSSPYGTVNEGSVTFEVLQGSTLIGTATANNVSNGSASVSYVLPAGTAAGSYTIVASYHDALGNFADSSDNTHTLIVNAASTTTLASNASIIFSPNAQNVPLTATVTSPAGTVNEGSVTFEVLQGSTLIGTATANNVSNGSVSVAYALPAGTPVGTYTIVASYHDSQGNFKDSSDNTHTLIVSAASTTTTASDASPTYSTSTQNVLLTASVTSPSGTVNEGTVTFKVLQGSTLFGTATANNVSNGSVSVAYALPAGTPVGTYTIVASYHDSQGNFKDSSDNTHTLIVSAASTTTTASNASIIFSPNAQNATLTATVTSPAGTVNEGTVTFEVMQGSTLIGKATTNNVSNSSVSVSYALPAGLATDSYTIVASYNDYLGNFKDNSDITHKLIVEPVPTTPAVTRVSVPYTITDMGDQALSNTATITANITDSAGIPIDVGQVEFDVKDSSGAVLKDSKGNKAEGTATVLSGQATAKLPIPPQTALGDYTVTATYSDSTGKFATSTGTGTLTVAAAHTKVTINNVSVDYTPFGETDTVTVYVLGETLKTDRQGFPVNGGFVTITDSGQTQTVKVDVKTSAATAIFNIPVFAEIPFTHSLTASYSPGDNNYLPNSSVYTINQEQIIFNYLIQIMILEFIIKSLSVQP
jgi:hypothetical protein